MSRRVLGTVGFVVLVLACLLFAGWQFFKPADLPVVVGRAEPYASLTAATAVVRVAPAVRATATPFSPEAALTAAAIISGSDASVVRMSKDTPGDSMRFYLEGGQYRFVWHEEWTRVNNAQGECQFGCSDFCATGGWLVSDDGTARYRVSPDISLALSVKQSGQFLYKIPAGNYYYSMYSHCRYEVAAYYVSPCDGPCQPAPTQSSAALYAVISSDKLNLRREPYEDADVIDIYRKGSRLNILGSSFSTTWLLVKTPDNNIGWIAAEFVQIDPPGSLVPTVLPPTRVPAKPAPPAP